MKSISKLHWHYIQDRHPDLAKRILAEYHKRSGFVPYEQGYVYLIHAVGSNYYKIGKSVNPDRRILQIAPQMPFPVRFIHLWHSNFMSLGEAYLHRVFQEHRTNGEWFAFAPEQLCSLLTSLGENVKYAYPKTFYDFVLSEDLDKMAEDFGFFSQAEMADHYFRTQTASDELRFVESIFSSISKSLSPGLPKDIEEQIDQHILLEMQIEINILEAEEKSQDV